MKIVDEKETTRKLYGFEPGEAFDLFYEGLNRSFSGFAATAIPSFEKSIDINPTNPVAYMYLVMMSEFAHRSNSTMVNLCRAWLHAAEISHNDMHIDRATRSLKYYESNVEERKQMRDAVGELLKNGGYSV